MQYQLFKFTNLICFKGKKKIKTFSPIIRERNLPVKTSDSYVKIVLYTRNIAIKSVQIETNYSEVTFQMYFSSKAISSDNFSSDSCSFSSFELLLALSTFLFSTAPVIISQSMHFCECLVNNQYLFFRH